jgi:heme ABC exporter ATP-binding subunit CcmA
MDALEARNLSRTTGVHRILDQVNLTISHGEIVAMIGANGTGKTTLLRCLAGQLRPSRGHVLWFGNSPFQRRSNRLLVGFAAHESYLYLDLSAQENLLFAARMYGISRVKERVAAVLKTMGLEERGGSPVRSLSKGMRQRVSLGRALIHEPPIVILDEPFAGLDTEGQQWLESWMSIQRAQMRTICFTSHDAQQCRRMAGRTIELRDGKLVRWNSCH